MNIVLQRMHELSDTELRIVLVIMHTTELLSVADLQQKTGRGRQVYDAIKTLLAKKIIARANQQIIDTITKWEWECAWKESLEQPILIIEPIASVMQQIDEAPAIVAPVIEELPPQLPDKKPRAKKEVVKNESQHCSAVKIYVDVTHRRPKHFVANTIAAAIVESEETLRSWKETVEQWILSGYNPLNIDGMLDMHKNKGNPQQNRQQRRKIVLNAVPTKSPEEELAKLQAYLLENNAYLHEEEATS